jgi:hypothetical protein
LDLISVVVLKDGMELIVLSLFVVVVVAQILYVLLQIHVDASLDIKARIVILPCVVKHVITVESVLPQTPALALRVGLIAIVLLLFVLKHVRMVVIVLDQIHANVPQNGVEMIVVLPNVIKFVRMMVIVWLRIHVYVHLAGLALIVVYLYVVKDTSNLIFIF